MRSLLSIAKRLAHRALRSVGLDVVRASSLPEQVWRSLSRLSIRSVIDIGANEGQFAQFALETFKNAKVCCFEPLPDVAARLSTWAEGSAGRVKVFPIALGEAPGEATMLRHREFSPSSSMLQTTSDFGRLHPELLDQERISVPIDTLDSALAGESLEDGILVKMDVQGFEDRVIRGATRTLGRARACTIEANLDSIYEGQARFDALVVALYGLGFQYGGNVAQVYDPRDGHVSYVDALFVKPTTNPSPGGRVT